MWIWKTNPQSPHKAVLSPNDFTKASSFYLCLYFSCFSSLWHHWHTLLSSLPYIFFLLSFLDNVFLYSNHYCCFIILIYLGKNKALSMPGRYTSSNNAKETYRKSWIIFCYLKVCKTRVCRKGKWGCLCSVTATAIPCTGFLEKRKAQYWLQKLLTRPP